jgi:hypothetical protein
MSTAQVIQISASSTIIFEDAIRSGIISAFMAACAASGSRSQQVDVIAGRVCRYRVNLPGRN